MIKCPNCGNDVFWDERHNTYEDDSEDAVICEVWGTCRRCNKAFYWKEKYAYTYAGSEDIEEDTEY